MTAITTLSEHWIASLFYWIGYRVGRRPVTYSLACLLSTALIAFGNIYARESSHTKDFVPLDAASRIELAEAEHFFGVNGGQMFRINIVAFAIDNGSLARRDYALQMIDFLETSTEVTRINDDSMPLNETNRLAEAPSNKTANDTQRNQAELVPVRRTYGFHNFCEPYCNINAPLTIFLKAFLLGNNALEYPISRIFGVELNIANNVYSVERNETTGYITGFRKAMIVYLLVLPKDDNSFGIRWEKELHRNSKNYDKLKLMIWSGRLIESEAREVGLRTAPSIVITIVLLGAFFMLTSFRQEPISSKPWEALFELAIPFFGIVSTFGILSLVGEQYHSILVATLFLLLAVCTDDGFIMLRAWDYALEYENETNTTYSTKSASSRIKQPEMSVERRTGLMLKLSGPAITITTLTNALSFGIGIFNRTPAIRTFCLYTTVAIMACFFYQVILYSAALAISARREKARMRSFFCCCKSSSPKRREWIVELNKLYDKVIAKWVDMITWKHMKVITALILVVYWAGAAHGISGIRTDLTADKLALPDSVFIVYQREQDKVWAEMQRLTVFITRPSNLLHSDEMSKLQQLVSDFESASYSYGPSSTLFWLPAYMEFISEISDGFTYTELPEFLKSAGFKHWRTLLHLNETACSAELPECILEYAFTTGFTSVTRFYDRIPLLTEWRRIASRYPELGVLPYNDVNAFVDLSATTHSTVRSSALASFVCISLACAIVIPHLVAVCVAVLTVISINIGVFGYLALIGVDLDPLSMASMLMAVGFSVDYTAHIGYHYYRIETDSAVERLRYALESMLWPMAQCALSTVIAMSPILLQPSYLSFVFSNTIFFVVGFSAFHGLVVLPVVLISLNVGGYSTNEDTKSKLLSLTRVFTIVLQRSRDAHKVPPEERA